MTIKIVLVDDQEIVRAGLRLLIQSQPKMQVVGEAKDGMEALSLCRQTLPDVIIMGLEHGDLEATRDLKRQYSSTLIVALITDDSKQHFYEMTQAGVSAYLPKSAAMTDLINAIHAAHMGQIVLHPSIATALVEGRDERSQATREALDSTRLTPSEGRVLELLADGAQNKVIAQRLGISVRTVARYQASLLRKLGLHTRAELVRYAVDQNLHTAA